MSSLRESIEAASLPAVRTIANLPRVVPFLVVLALMVAGIAVPGWGWVFFALVLLFLAWMLYLGWPRLTRSERFMRTAILALVLAVTITRAFPQS